MGLSTPVSSPRRRKEQRRAIVAGSSSIAIPTSTPASSSATCPAIGGPRTWEMGDAVRALVTRLQAQGERVFGPALFVCRHHVFGVGTFAVDAVLEGDETVKTAGASGEPAAVLVGTVSSCHGALNLLRIGAAK